jgi:hypothetical protein
MKKNDKTNALQQFCENKHLVTVVYIEMCVCIQHYTNIIIFPKCRRKIIEKRSCLSWRTVPKNFIWNSNMIFSLKSAIAKGESSYITCCLIIG